ncbi:hypothetical protein Pla163_27510 [Planctomycetes bacterium Pla163]|uniref:Uncharacterized protein n=1 Tax=Rohdeia mirabilis TaxID=2528008 RepID=A0A518D2E0_9BACT|nr:hypothetical protein Pla163_27510 [Planctomycetes bacterium Pla163]
MQRFTVAALALVASAALATLAVALRPTPTAAPATLEVIERVPFSLASPATHWFRAEQPSFAAGELVVVRSNGPDLTLMGVATPVLYCGAETAQQLNIGSSGYVVCVVPFAADADRVDGSGPWFLGAPELPERVTLATARAEYAGALDRGARRQPVEPRARVELADEIALSALAADLVERFVEGEADTVRALRGE